MVKRQHETGLVLGEEYRDALTETVGVCIGVWQEIGGAPKALLQWLDGDGNRTTEWLALSRLLTKSDGVVLRPAISKLGDTHARTGIVYGYRYHDEIHGTTGHATKIVDYLYGCARVTVERISGRGRLIEATYDYPELIDDVTGEKPRGSIAAAAGEGPPG